MRRSAAAVVLVALLGACRFILPLEGRGGDTAPARDVAASGRDATVTLDNATSTDGVPEAAADGPLLPDVPALPRDLAPADVAAPDAAGGCQSYAAWSCSTPGTTSCTATCTTGAGLAQLQCLYVAGKAKVRCTCTASWTSDNGTAEVSETSAVGCGFCAATFLSACPPGMFP